jgi:hypothetical protein
MVCIEVKLNGHLLRMAGIKDASLISPMVSGYIGGDMPASLMLSGMCDLPDDRAAHVYWAPDELDLKSGDVVTFKFVESDDPTKPERIVLTDSPEYIEEQRQFTEMKKSFVPDTSAPPQNYPALAFDCRVNGSPAAVARLNVHEQHILCSVLWNKWRPERFRVLVRSFGNKFADDSETEWVRCDLALGDELEIEVAA